MHNSQKDFLLSYTNLGRKCTLIDFIRAICLSKLPLPVTLPAAIARVKKRARIWTIGYSGKLSTRLVNTELEVSAYTCLGSRSYIPISLTLSDILNGGIKVTLSSLPQTGQKLTNVSMILYLAGLTKHCGRTGRKQDLEEPPY